MPTTLINKLEFDSIKQQLSYSYFATYQHMGPYCLGIFTGYLLYKRPNVRLPKHLTWALWILLPPLSLTTLFLTYLWNGAYNDDSLINPSPIVSALYVAIHRTIWTSLVAWIVFACATGRAKLLSNFLSHSMFIPISRLSFSIYLVHLPVIMFRALNLRHTIEWTDSNILWEACGNFIVSLIVGYFVNVTFESPITNLEQVIFGRHKRQLSSPQVSPSISPKLRPQSISKTSSENDSDDSKSAKSSDLAANKASSLASQETRPPLSDSSGIGSSETASQLLDRHMRWSMDRSPGKFTSLRRKPPMGDRRSARGKEMRPALMSDFVEYDDVDGDLDDTLTSDSGSPVINSPKDALRQSRLSSAAPAVKPLRRLSAFEVAPTNNSKSDRSSSIYQMAPSEYQIYATRQTSMLKRVDPSGTGGLARGSQYATLAYTSRFSRESAPPEDRHEYQRPSFVRPMQTISQLGTIGDSSVSRSSQRSSNLIRTSFHLDGGHRRQGRYNTLTGAGSREWRQHTGVSSQEDKWLMNARTRAQDTFQMGAEASPSWMLQPGAMIPRIDSSTLRGASMRKDATRTNSIVEEEREDVIR